MQNPIHLHHPAHIASLRLHCGESETTLVMGEVPIAWSAGQREGIRVPYLLVAFSVDHAGIIDRRGYAIEREGKPLDFELERWHHRRRGRRTTRPSAATTRLTEYPNADGSTHREASATTWLWPETAWSTEAIIPLPWNGQTPPTVSRIAKPWVYTSAGKTRRLRWYDSESGGYLRTFDEASAALQEPRPKSASCGSGLKTSAALANDGGHTATRCFDSVSAGHEHTSGIKSDGCIAC